MKANSDFIIARKPILTFAFSLLFTISSMTAYAASPESDSSQTIQVININTADAKTIASALKGIGLKKAEAIVDYRDRYGEFAHLDELIAVKGIGKNTLSKNAHLLSLN